MSTPENPTPEATYIDSPPNDDWIKAVHAQRTGHFVKGTGGVPVPNNDLPGMIVYITPKDGEGFYAEVSVVDVETLLVYRWIEDAATGWPGQDPEATRLSWDDLVEVELG